MDFEWEWKRKRKWREKQTISVSILSYWNRIVFIYSLAGNVITFPCTQWEHNKLWDETKSYTNIVCVCSMQYAVCTKYEFNHWYSWTYRVWHHTNDNNHKINEKKNASQYVPPSHNFANTMYIHADIAIIFIYRHGRWYCEVRHLSCMKREIRCVYSRFVVFVIIFVVTFDILV